MDVPSVWNTWGVAEPLFAYYMNKEKVNE